MSLQREVLRTLALSAEEKHVVAALGYGDRDERRADTLALKALVSLSTPINVAVDPNDDMLGNIVETAGQFGLELINAINGQGKNLKLPYPACFFHGPMLDYRNIDAGGPIGAPRGKTKNALVAVDMNVLASRLGKKTRDSILLIGTGFAENSQYLSLWTSPLYELDVDGISIVNSMMMGVGRTEEEKEYLFNMISGWVTAIYGLLHMKQVIKTEKKAPEKLNKARTKKGKDPITGSLTIHVNKEAFKHHPGPGTHASPRPHWRRGHVRVLGSGKISTVSPCLVNGVADLPTNVTVKV